jgi:hypothetical protein
MLAVVRRVCHILLPTSTFLRSIIVCIIAYFLSSLWPAPGLLVVIKLLLVSVTIVVLFLLIGELNRSDFIFFRVLLRQGSETPQ